MSEIAKYSAEGMQAANTARNTYLDLEENDNNSWKDWDDSWREFGMNYALQQQANQHEIDMWQLNNEYNTPSAQMARLKAAGLNPNLMYQLGNSGNSSSAPGTHTFKARNNSTEQKLQKLAAVNQTASSINGTVQQFLSTYERYLENNWLQELYSINQYKTNALHRMF